MNQHALRHIVYCGDFVHRLIHYFIIADSTNSEGGGVFLRSQPCQCKLYKCVMWFVNDSELLVTESFL